MVNEAAESGAWFFKVKLSDLRELDGLMDRAAYDAFVAGLE
jgi:glycine cleavage system H protein